MEFCLDGILNCVGYFSLSLVLQCGSSFRAWCLFLSSALSKVSRFSGRRGVYLPSPRIIPPMLSPFILKPKSIHSLVGLWALTPWSHASSPLPHYANSKNFSSSEYWSLFLDLQRLIRPSWAPLICTIFWKVSLVTRKLTSSSECWYYALSFWTRIQWLFWVTLSM